jgi:hypothetical protein
VGAASLFPEAVGPALTKVAMPDPVLAMSHHVHWSFAKARGMRTVDMFRRVKRLTGMPDRQVLDQLFHLPLDQELGKPYPLEVPAWWPDHFRKRCQAWGCRVVDLILAAVP